MTLPTIALPTAELVAVAWVRQYVPELNGIVATSLPRETEKWAGTGFVTVRALPGGVYNPSGTKRSSMVQVDAWWSATSGTSSSTKPQWGKANQLIEVLLAATEEGAVYSTPLDLPADTRGAVVLAVYPAGDPQKVEDDPSGYARYTMDLVVDWARS
jgi:hypothetical protein